MLRAYKHPQPPPVGRQVTYGTVSPATRAATRAAEPVVAARVAAVKPAAIALAAHRTRSVAHRDLMEKRAVDSAACLAASPAYKARTTPHVALTNAEFESFINQFAV